MIICTVNKSTLVSSSDVYDMTLAADWQLRHHAAPAWGRIPPQTSMVADESLAPPGSAVIGILDNANQAGVLGWHTEGPDGKIYGRVFAEPVLQNGGTILSGQLSVSSVLSHEALETFGDEHCNLWGDLGTGQCYAVELGDPVESDSYDVTLTSAGQSLVVSVSDFVRPEWFDPSAPAGSRFDHMGVTSAPFQVRPTGYVIVLDGGVVTQQWGAEYPEWRKAMKETETSRTFRRAHRLT